MKQQYILKLILLRVSLCSVQLSLNISRIPCFINNLFLYVAYLSLSFGNSKMVTECKLKPISMNFGFPRKRASCVGGKVQDWIGQKKKTILATISNLFLLQQKFDQSYATNRLCNIFPYFLPNLWFEGVI